MFENERVTKYNLNMKNYYKVILGKQHSWFKKCYEGGYIGLNYDMDINFAEYLPDSWREFNKRYIPYYLEKHPDASKIAAGLACGNLHAISKSLEIGHVVLCRNEIGEYYFGEIISDYKYYPDRTPLHCRDVKWLNITCTKEDFSPELQTSLSSSGAVVNLNKYSEEIESLISGSKPETLYSSDETVENPSMFALEDHLEDFLIKNWDKTDLATKYELFEDEEAGLFGKQFQTDTGFIDILAVSKDKKEVLVIELKKGRASDRVVGQIQRYMGYIKDEFLETGQVVKGLIIALENNKGIERALKVTNDISFYKYKVNFELEKIF